jgi:hypothetical protein
MNSIIADREAGKRTRQLSYGGGRYIIRGVTRGMNNSEGKTIFNEIK